MEQQIGVVFLHGAGLAGWIWEGVAKLLNYPSLILEFPNRESIPGANKRLSLDDYCVTLRQSIDPWEPQRFVLVTHSISGVVGVKLAAELKPRVAGFACLSAHIPAKGGSFLSVLPFPQRALLRVALRLAGTKPPEKVIRKSLCNGLTGMQARRVVKAFTPESRRLYVDACKVPAPAVRSLYIKQLKDESMPVPFQERMASNLLSPQTASVDAGHLGMLTHSMEVATILDQFTRSCV